MDWQKVVEMPDGEERDRDLAALLKQLPYLDDSDREREVERLIRAEYSLDDQRLRSASLARLRSVLAQDDEGARKIAETYDTVMNRMPGDIAFRRAAVVQTVARHEFSVEEEARLRSLIPNVLGEKPSEVSVETPGPQEPVHEYPRQRWWMFWQRKKAEARRDAAEVTVPDIEERFSGEVADQLQRTRQV